MVADDNGGSMAFVITKPCIGVKDTACVAVCPCDCIHPTKDEADFDRHEMLYIDPNVCVDCGLCVDECPARAIFQELDVPADGRSLLSGTPRIIASDAIGEETTETRRHGECNESEEDGGSFRRTNGRSS
jgi:ferredoxin